MQSLIIALSLERGGILRVAVYIYVRPVFLALVFVGIRYKHLKHMTIKTGPLYYHNHSLRAAHDVQQATPSVTRSDAPTSWSN